MVNMTAALPAIPNVAKADVRQWMTANGEVFSYTAMNVVRDNRLDVGVLVSLAMGILTLPVPNVAQADWCPTVTVDGTVVNHVGVSAARDKHECIPAFLSHLVPTVRPLSVPDVTPTGRCSPGTTEGAIVRRVAASDVRAKHEGMVTFLSQLAPDVLIDEKALAKGFGLKSVKAIQRWTNEGHLPPVLPMPGNLRRVGSILDWIRALAEMGDKKALEYRRHLAELKNE